MEYPAGATEADDRDLARIFDSEFSALSARSSASSSWWSLAHAVDVLRVFLLLAQIFSQFDGISDGLLRSLLSAFVFGQGLIESLEFSLELSLGGRQAAGLSIGLIGLVTGIGGFVLSLLAGTLRGFVGNQKFFLKSSSFSSEVK
ncbi:hypothetical protein WR25_20318 [Diploscapter pachys]|uniref:Uncharacterized protein n=1 Tax=Diploscapter pachys TaxID=2018661 RepID=A0A2A2L6D9_9BILA|nr:hypothetical protein WR25_20318 [Diploscapter pachys]